MSKTRQHIISTVGGKTLPTLKEAARACGFTESQWDFLRRTLQAAGYDIRFGPNGVSFELGYTPNNLRMLLSTTGTTRERAAELIGVGKRAVDGWCLPLGNPNHRDMPAGLWETLVEAVAIK